jgi:hypothetical protein
MSSNSQVIFLIAYYDKKLGPQLLGRKFLSKPGTPKFSEAVLNNISVDALLTRSNPLILYIKDEEKNPYIIQVKKFKEDGSSPSKLFNSAIAIIFIIPKVNTTNFPIPIRKEFILRIFNECKTLDDAEYFVFNFNLGLDEYLDTVNSQNAHKVLNSSSAGEQNPTI